MDIAIVQIEKLFNNYIYKVAHNLLHCMTNRLPTTNLASFLLNSKNRNAKNKKESTVTNNITF